MKNIFGIDLTGYQVKVDMNRYIFSKKGGLTVTAIVNEKGKIYGVDQAGPRK
ncbi:hypothetical protein WDD9_000168 [Paenibacillus melissococcoides]|nr:hypothetical protein [Paenibacillus melissococcoides]CAH8703480.1 hypothetical protein WDD9_000168 [Paenibacillus melissococcoides]